MEQRIFGQFAHHVFAIDTKSNFGNWLKFAKFQLEEHLKNAGEQISVSGIELRASMPEWITLFFNEHEFLKPILDTELSAVSLVTAGYDPAWEDKADDWTVWVNVSERGWYLEIEFEDDGNCAVSPFFDFAEYERLRNKVLADAV